MTVCIGALFRFAYDGPSGPPIDGVAGIIVSDRMITIGDQEYEPNQLKIAVFQNRAALAIAGDYTVHSQAIKDAFSQVRTISNPSPKIIADHYGRAVKAVKTRLAEDRYLAPFGLNTDTYLAQQKEMSPDFVSLLASQIQDYRGADTAALIIASDGENAQLYEVDSDSEVRCYDDAGFAAIGIGAWHARSRMMQAGYTNMWRFGDALSLVFAAKKAAEAAPGVGTATDIHIVFKNSVEPLRPEFMQKLEHAYKGYALKRDDCFAEMVAEVGVGISEVIQNDRTKNDGPKVSSEDSETDERPRPATAEAARGNEVEKPAGE